jgi:hypothetical protein
LLSPRGPQHGSLVQPVVEASHQLRPGVSFKCKSSPSLQRRTDCISLCCLTPWLVKLPSSRWAIRGLTPSSRGRPASGPPLTSNVRAHKCLRRREPDQTPGAMPCRGGCFGSVLPRMAQASHSQLIEPTTTKCHRITSGLRHLFLALSASLLGTFRGRATSCCGDHGLRETRIGRACHSPLLFSPS